MNNLGPNEYDEVAAEKFKLRDIETNGEKANEADGGENETKDDINKKEMPKPDPNRKTIIEPLRPL